MEVKKTQHPKLTDDDISKISADMKNEIKEKAKMINEYAKIINGTKKNTKNCTQKILSTEIS